MAGQASYQRVRLLVKDSNGNYHDVAGDIDGKLLIGATIEVGDVEIGAVELKDGATDTRAKVVDPATIVITDPALHVRDLEPGVANFVAATVSIPTTAGGTALVAARAARRGVLITNLGTDTVYVGQGTVTSAMYPVYANGERHWLPVSGALKALAASGTQNVLVGELY